MSKEVMIFNDSNIKPGVSYVEYFDYQVLKTQYENMEQALKLCTEIARSNAAENARLIEEKNSANQQWQEAFDEYIKDYATMKCVNESLNKNIATRERERGGFYAFLVFNTVMWALDWWLK